MSSFAFAWFKKIKLRWAGEGFFSLNYSSKVFPFGLDSAVNSIIVHFQGRIFDGKRDYYIGSANAYFYIRILENWALATYYNWRIVKLTRRRLNVRGAFRTST